METLEGRLSRLSPEQRRLLQLLLRQEQATHFAPPTDQIPPRDLSIPAPLSFTQQRFWFMHQLEPNSPAYNMRTVVRLHGPLDLAALHRSLTAIVERHEVLRTSFPSQDGRPIQTIAAALPLPLPLVDLRCFLPDMQPAQVRHYTLHETEQPFDLERGPLLRACLLRLSDTEHVLILTMHHSISDGWSQGIQLRELSALYAAFTHGRPSPLPELPLQYADFAAWQRQWLQGPRLAQLLVYWQEHLGARAHVLDLPTDRPRPVQAGTRGTADYYTFPLSLRDQLISLSRREGVTLFMTLLAAFNVLLSRYSGQTDIVVGTPVSGRTRHELEDLIGCFVNMLPLRTNVEGNPPFAVLLRRVRSVLLAAYAHQELPFEQLVEALQLPRDLSRNPIFQVLLVLQNMPMPALVSGELTLLPQEAISTAAVLDLSLYVREVPEGLRIRVEYNTDLFDAATISRMIKSFQLLLMGIVANPTQPIAGLPLLGPEEREQLLVNWNATSTPYPQTLALNQMFEVQAERTPDALAVIHAGKHLTYRELNTRANQLAHALQARGVGPEVRVGIMVERSLEMLVGLLGILKAGGAYVPLDPDFPPERLQFMLEDSRPAVLLTTTDDRRPSDEDRGLKIEDSGPDADHKLSSIPYPPSSSGAMVGGPWSVVDLVADWPDIAQQPADEPTNLTSGDNLAYVLYTSGSTGQPKGVQISHRALVNFLVTIGQKPGIDAHDILLAVTTLSFDIAGLELYLPLTVGACVEVLSRDTATDGMCLAERLAAPGASMIQATPATWRMLLAAGWRGNPRLRILCGGEALPRDLANQLVARSTETWNMYGPTETTIWSTIERVRAGEGPISIGRPIGNTQVYLLDRHLRPVPIGVSGELYIGGAGLARGYLGRPDLTAERFLPNPFARIEDRGSRIEDSHAEASEMRSSIPNPPSSQDRGLKREDRSLDASHERSSILNPPSSSRLYRTGDLARYRADGTIEYLGRIDQQIKLRGFRIELGEIENRLNQHPALREAVAAVWEDQPSNKRLVAYIVMAEDEGWKIEDGTADASHEPSSILYPRPSFTQELRRHLARYLPEYMIPTAYIMLERLPLSPNGKVDRRALPVPQAVGVDATAYVAPSMPTEVALARVWVQVLGVERIGVHDNFFELGGDSLLAMQLVARAHQAGLQLVPRQIFAHQTIAELARVLGAPSQMQTEQAIVIGPLPLTESPAWLLNQGLAEAQRPYWHIVRLFDVPPNLDPAALRQVTAALLRHHDALRARFVQQANGWQTWIAPPDDRVPFEYIDLTAVPDHDLSTTIEHQGNTVQARINLAEGPLLLVVYMDCGPTRAARLLVVVHHLVADLHAIWIILDDLLSGYQQLQQGQPLQLTPKTAPLTAWGACLHAYAQSPQQRAALEAWCQLPWNTIPPLPRDYLVPREAAICSSRQTIRMALDTDTTQRLIRRLPARYQAQLVEGLMAALLYGLMQWSQADQFGLLTLEVGRDNLPNAEDIDVSRTVGWFSHSRYVILERAAGSTPDKVLEATIGQLRRTPGLRYDLHRYVSGNPASVELLKGLPRYEILFNYAGQMLHTETSLMVRPSIENCHSQGAPDDPVPYVLECWIVLINGQLSARLLYSTQLHRPETIERLAQEFLVALRALAVSEQ